MDAKLSQFFKSIKEIEPSERLEGLILGRIKTEKVKQLKIKLTFSFAGFISSFAAGVWATFSFGSSIIKSEFWNLASLAFSDVMIVAGNWKTYGYSLIETFPTVNLALILIPIFGLVVSIGFYLDLRSKGKHIYHSRFKLA
jgi:hypothetical protein